MRNPNVNPKRKATPEEAEQVISASLTGLTNAKIAADLGLHGQVVNGIVASARNAGKLPRKSATPVIPPVEQGLFEPVTAPDISASEEVQMAAPQTPTTPAAAAPPVQPTDDFAQGGRTVMGTPGGFVASSQGVRYSVERIVPADGMLGTHHGSLSTEELGQLYGAGTYKILRHDAGRAAPVEFIQKIAEFTYGPPKSGSSSTHSHVPQARPQIGGVASPYPQHEQSRPYDVVERIFDKSLKQIEEARGKSPDASVAEIFKQQQTLLREQFAEERKRDELRREDERKRDDARREDERIRHERDRQLEIERHDRERAAELARYERDQRAQKDAHERECARIKADNDARLKMEADQREFLLKLEDKKLQVVKEQTADAQRRLEAEIKASRDQAAAIQQAAAKEIERSREETEKTISEAEKRAEAERKREREFREKEFSIKEKALDRDFELQSKIVDLKSERTGDSITSVLSTVMREGSKGLSQVAEIAKLKAMGPEAQAQWLASQGLAPMPGQAAAPAPQQQPPVQQQPQQPQTVDQVVRGQAAAVPTNGHGLNGNGHLNLSRIEALITEQLQSETGRDVLSEWCLHVESGCDASALSCLFTDLCRSQEDEKREASLALAAFMKPRRWNKVYAVIRPVISPDMQAILDRPEADAFYEQFRALVVLEFQNYADDQINARLNKGKPSPATNSVPSVDVTVATPPTETPVDQAPAVPSREVLQGHFKAKAEASA